MSTYVYRFITVIDGEENTIDRGVQCTIEPDNNSGEDMANFFLKELMSANPGKSVSVRFIERMKL
jgi:hypothetical protein